jgi:two-component system sensor histidine kinase PilS (NtrC family)
MTGIQTPMDSFLGAVTPNSRGVGRLFFFYNSYRVTLGACLLALLILPGGKDFITGFDRLWFGVGASLMLVSIAPLTRRLGERIHQSEASLFALLITDILAITVLLSATGGLLSGFAVLFIITVAAGSFLLHSRSLATLVAAIATFAVLTNAAWLVERQEADVGLLLPAGLLGSLLFFVSLLVQETAKRLAFVETQAQLAATEVEALEQLNEQIVAHMQTGILRIDDRGFVEAVNDSALKLLQLKPRNQYTLGEISVDLEHQYAEWRSGLRKKPEPFRRTVNSPAVIASFAGVNTTKSADTLIFVEDYTPFTQFAQSLKLDSLSKLTASIAHEIRNPLSAISHAAQLLGESDTVQQADRLLCDILVSNSVRVSDIIDNVTEVSRRQAPHPTQLLLQHWTTECITEYKGLRAEPCSISINSRVKDVGVIFDPSHLKRVLTNLFDNGLRHSEADSQRAELRIDVEVDPVNRQVLMDVVDYGNGVAESQLGRLFEPFFTTSRQGSGLGLYLCKELCEINGADLFYQRTSTGESAFRLSLKLDEDFR